MQSTKIDASAVRSTLRRAADALKATDAFLLTFVPGGRLRVAQSLRPNDPLVRRYTQEYFLDDAFAGTVLREGAGRWAGADSVWRVMAGYESGIGVAVPSPVLAGYPGVLLLFRNQSAEPFSANDLEKLTDLIVDQSPDKPGGRLREFNESDDKSVLVFESHDRLAWPENGLRGVDERLVEHIQDHVKAGFNHTEIGATGRVGVPGKTGEHHSYQFIKFAKYPVTGGGPVVVACKLPSFEAWSHVTPADFEADPELTRLMPAIQFMVEQFARGPTLEEIAASVHLSQFHFHRRFSELIGITPKHLLFDLQLHLAKSLLADPTKALADIASICGFAHQSHFTSRFKQGTGLTPTRWRRVNEVR